MQAVWVPEIHLVSACCTSCTAERKKQHKESVSSCSDMEYAERIKQRDEFITLLLLLTIYNSLGLRVANCLYLHRQFVRKKKKRFQPSVDKTIHENIVACCQFRLSVTLSSQYSSPLHENERGWICSASRPHPLCPSTVPVKGAVWVSDLKWSASSWSWLASCCCCCNYWWYWELCYHDLISLNICLYSFVCCG